VVIRLVRGMYFIVRGTCMKNDLASRRARQWY